MFHLHAYSPFFITALNVAISFQSIFSLLLSGKNKLKALYLFIYRCCNRFTYPWAWFPVLNCKHYKMRLF